MTDTRFPDRNPDRKRKKIIFIALAAIMAIVIILLLTRCSKKEGGESYSLRTDPASTYGQYTGRDKNEIIDELNGLVEEGMMNISMNLNPVFENGTSEGNLLIYNSENNRHPQIVEIYLKDSDRLIYRSGCIQCGYGIEYARLLLGLEKGEYQCIAYFSAIDEISGDCLGKAGAEILITVLN